MSPQLSSVGTSGGKQVVGNWVHSQTSGMQGPHYKMKKLNTQAKGQWAACDIYTIQSSRKLASIEIFS